MKTKQPLVTPSAGPALSTSAPRYAQIMVQLESELRRRRPGDVVPKQRDLAARFGSSMITIRRAMMELGRMGLVEATRGRGTVVRRPTVVDAHTGVSSWTDSMMGVGGHPQTAWTRIRTGQGSERVRRWLGLKSGAEVVTLQRLRMLDGKPACLMVNHLPADRVPGLEHEGLDDQSLYAVLQRRFGFKPSYADEEVKSRPSQSSERAAFGKDCRTVVCVQRLTYDKNDRPIELAQLSAPADSYTYRVRLMVDPAAASSASQPGSVFSSAWFRRAG